jgi:protocatechuate 3,4-dioxygenase alpha subunit
MRLQQTPSQTVGPYFAYGLTPEQYGYPFRAVAGAVLTDDDTSGERIRIVGRVLDGDGGPVPDAMIEIWQADAEGRYAHPADQRGSNVRFKGFGRCGTGTDPEHRFVFDTIKPGASEDGRAPHINVIVFMRGLLSHVFTRIYFADEAEANASDPVLASVEAARRHTLIAARETTPAGTFYRFDIRMQGPDETVFFDV